jgi:deoxyribonuclease I
MAALRAARYAERGDAAMRWVLLVTLAGCPAPTDTDTDTDRPDTDEPDCDVDGDGFVALSCGGDDCDDLDPDRHPGAPERCNGLDDDCDGAAHFEDEDCAPCEAAGLFAQVAPLAEDPAALRAALRVAVAPVRCSYRESGDRLFTLLDKVDGHVSCVYTGTRVEVGNTRPDGDLLNIEHTWPQSQGADREPARCDLHHLFPTTPASNNARGNLPFGEVSAGVRWEEGGSRASATAFEPRDPHKGDAARAMLYFSLRYDLALPADQRDLFAAWHAEFPPDAGDRARSATIARWQGAHNPFVVCPFVEAAAR